MTNRGLPKRGRPPPKCIVNSKLSLNEATTELRKRGEDTSQPAAGLAPSSFFCLPLSFGLSSPS